MATKARSDKSDTERRSTTQKKNAMLKALEKSLGVVTDALQTKGVTIHRSTHYDWINSDPEYRRKVEEIQDVALDFVESANFKAIEAGSESLIRFFLKTKGRRRGYVEKQDVIIGTSEPDQMIEWRITSKNRMNGKATTGDNNGHLSK